jgi:hypothetical protein
VKRWVPRAALAVYLVLLLAATVRAWLKFDVETAGKVLAFGLVFGIVLWRAWRYIIVVAFGGRFPRR